MATTKQEQIIQFQEGLKSKKISKKIKKDIKKRLDVLLAEESAKEKSDRLALERSVRETAAKASILSKAEQEAESIGKISPKSKPALREERKPGVPMKNVKDDFDCIEEKAKWEHRKKVARKHKKEPKKPFSQIFKSKVEALALAVAQSKKFKSLDQKKKLELYNDMVNYLSSAKKVYSKYAK